MYDSYSFKKFEPCINLKDSFNETPSEKTESLKIRYRLLFKILLKSAFKLGLHYAITYDNL